MQRQPYPSDLTDEQWAEIEALIPPPKPGGRPRVLGRGKQLHRLPDAIGAQPALGA